MVKGEQNICLLKIKQILLKIIQLLNSDTILIEKKIGGGFLLGFVMIKQLLSEEEKETMAMLIMLLKVFGNLYIIQLLKK